MDVIILGSGSPMPHPDRAGPATLVQVGSGRYLFECGRGVPRAERRRRWAHRIRRADPRTPVCSSWSRCSPRL